MKDLFPGHFKESEGHLREVWETSIFVFDANILLNLYRYSDTTRSEFLRILKKLEDRIWLPHKAAEEYLTNRLSVIDQQEKSYDDTTKMITSLENDLENARQHPFVSSATMDKVRKVFDELCEELKKNKAVHTKRISNDEIKNSIASIFENKVGEPFDEARLKEIISIGEERFKQKVPPGFKDASKFADSEVFVEKCKKYGDLIVWTQVIEKAIESKKGIVLVTDDKKDDWWEKFKGKMIGPRPELVKEFKEKANGTFHMYQADRFLELARENLNEQVSDSVVEEIREVKRRDKIARKRMLASENLTRQSDEIKQLSQELESSKTKLKDYEVERSLLHNQLLELTVLRNELMESEFRLSLSAPKSTELKEKQLRLSEVSDQCSRVRDNLEHIKRKKQSLVIRTLELETELNAYMVDIERQSALAL